MSHRREAARSGPARARVEPVAAALSLVVGLVVLPGAFPILGCGGYLIFPGDGDGDGDVDGDVDVSMPDADEAQDLDADDDEAAVPPQPSEWAALVTEVTVLTEPCDVRGVPSNSLRSHLGDLLAAQVAQRLSDNINGVLETRDDGMLIYAPSCQDLASFTDPEFDLAMIGVVRDGTTSLAKGSWLNLCGEAVFMMRGSLANGALHVVDDRMQFPLVVYPVPFQASHIDGTLSASGAEVTVCGYAAARDLATVSEPGSDLTFLEIVVYPAVALGNSDFVGVQPDVDVDDDGLEQFRIDALTGQLSACLDDSGQVIASGRSCAADDEVQDGFSFNVRLAATAATLNGCVPAWEETAASCDGGPSGSGLCGTDAGQ